MMLLLEEPTNKVLELLESNKGFICNCRLVITRKKRFLLQRKMANTLSCSIR